MHAMHSNFSFFAEGSGGRPPPPFPLSHELIWGHKLLGNDRRTSPPLWRGHNFAPSGQHSVSQKFPPFFSRNFLVSSLLFKEENIVPSLVERRARIRLASQAQFFLRRLLLTVSSFPPPRKLLLYRRTDEEPHGCRANKNVVFYPERC